MTNDETSAHSESQIEPSPLDAAVAPERFGCFAE